MECSYQVYLICYHNRQPIDFLLPIYTRAQFEEIFETAGTCFKIRDPRNAEIMLACYQNDEIHTTRINIESACKANANISFSIIIDETGHSAFLRAFTDKEHNDFYPISFEFIDKGRFD